MITMKDIITENNPNLRKKSSIISFPLDEKNKNLIKNMLEFVKNSTNPKYIKKYNLIPSVGIAAPQLNLLKRIAVVHIENESNTSSFILINPKIIKHSIDKICLEEGEGCLSVRRSITGRVPRYTDITIENFTPEGKVERLEFSNYLSIVVQHEIDHLDGILFYDRISNEDCEKLLM